MSGGGSDLFRPVGVLPCRALCNRVDPKLGETKHRFVRMRLQSRWCLFVKAVGASWREVLCVQNDETADFGR